MAIPATGAAQQVIDPVCGMQILDTDAVGQQQYRGTTYYFCSSSCQEKFAAKPEAYVGGAAPAATAPSAVGADTREYTCPMDPEVRQIGPGTCPKCGMALEPTSAAPATRTEWTCPMHPEIVRDAPGACPICGMALEPRTVTLEDRNPGTRGHDAAVHMVARADGTDPRRHAGRPDPRAAP